MKIWPFSRKRQEFTEDSDIVTFVVPGEVKRHLQAGKELYDKREFDRAIEQYQNALRIDPDCALIHFNLGFVQHEKWDLPAAKRSYHRAIELDPKCPLFHEHLGKLYFDTEEYAQSILFLEKAAELGVIRPLSYGILGRAHLARKEYHKSIAALTRMLERERNTTLRIYGNYYLCAAHLDLENLVEARAIGQSILDDPHAEFQVLKGLAGRFLEASSFSIAEALYKRALTMATEPDDRLNEALGEIQEIQERIDNVLPRVFCGDEEVVLQNIHLLNQFGSEKVSRALLSIADTKSPLIREAVIEYNRRHGFAVWREVLPFMADNQGYVREKAAGFLKNFDEPEVAGLMRTALFDELVPVKMAAVQHLKRFGRFDAVPVLTEALAAEWDPEVRDALSEAVSAIKERERKKDARKPKYPISYVSQYEIGPLGRLTSSRARYFVLVGLLLSLVLILVFMQEW